MPPPGGKAHGAPSPTARPGRGARSPIIQRPADGRGWLKTVKRKSHNQVTRRAIGGREVWLHRKGAAPAEQGQLTVVLGSRGAPTHLMRGTGEVAGLESVAHGAGRRMTRTEALSKMRAKHRRDSLGRTALGGRVLCDRTEALYEEHPDVYKPIQPVIASISAAGLATPVATLTPLITVKR
jgi:release factor H-coupled RctB family protein